MSNSIDWGNLVAKNRAKAFGVAWSQEELDAIAAGVSPEEIREGKWKAGKAAKKAPTVAGSSEKKDEPETLEQFLANPKTKHEALKAKAEELKVELKPDATKAEIVEAITNATKQPK